MSWAATGDAILALQNIINDGPFHKLAWNKKVIGLQDGTNSIFKTFEYRRTVQFTAASSPVGVFLNSVAVPASGIVSDDLPSGTFVLGASSLPQERDSLRATYYYQWFIESELDQFLQDASSWLQFGTTYINLDDGLNACALRFAAQEAYLSLAARYATRLSQGFQLEDAPSEDILKSVAAWKDMADGYLKSAETMRDDFYKRAGQPLAPNFSFSLGKVYDPTPRR